MDTRYLKSLIAVVERGSIADAARAENLTAAAVSQRIQALERELGQTLLTRVGHAAKATDVCYALLPRARRIVQEVALLPDDADPAGLTGTLNLGVISTALTGMVPAALQTLKRLAPGIRPHVVPGASKSLYALLVNGEIDAALLVAPPFELAKSLAVVSLRREPLVLLSRKKPKVSIAATLQQHPYIRYDPHSWGGRLADAYLKRLSLSVDPVFDLDALEAIAMLVADNVGVSLVPHWTGLERIATQCAITPVGDDKFSRELVLMTTGIHQRPHVMAALLQALQG